MAEPAVRRRAAVLGSPILHSLSPVLHRAAYAQLGLDWQYDAIEVGETDRIFTNPRHKLTEDYITGRFG